MICFTNSLHAVFLLRIQQVVVELAPDVLGQHAGAVVHQRLACGHFQRVRRAHEDLMAHKGSIRSVSMKWHFSSPQHMAVAFKRVLGITPSMVV